MSKWKTAIVPNTWSPITIAALSIEQLRPMERAASRRLSGTPSPCIRSGRCVACPLSRPALRGAGRGNTQRTASAISPAPARQWIRPSSPSEPIARFAPGSNRETLAQMASKTGCTSATDPAITRSTSEVAVCRSRASWVRICSTSTCLSERVMVNNANAPSAADSSSSPTREFTR